MINQVVLVGRIKQLPQTDDNDVLHGADMILQVMRPFAESDGTYGYDEVIVSMWNGPAMSLKESCTIGTMVGIKGRIEQCKSQFLCKVIAKKIAVLQPGDLPLQK